MNFTRIVFCFIALFCANANANGEGPLLTLTGPCLVIQGLQTKYSEAGYTAKDASNNDITNMVTISGSVDTAHAGRYELLYCVTSSAITVCKKRVIVITNYGYAGSGTTIYDSLNIPVGVTTDTIAKRIDYLRTHYALIITPTGSPSVDYNNVGIYMLTYTISDSICGSLNLVVKVKVVDTKPPIINLLGSNPMCVELFTGFVDPWAIVMDNYWSPSTISIVRKGTVNTSLIGIYYITYIATDPSGNKDSVTRIVKVGDCSIKYEKGSPTIVLLGNCLMTVRKLATYSEPGYMAIDSSNNDITGKVVKTGSVNTTVEGRYELRYCVTEAGITKCTKRVVLVSSLLSATTNSEGKISLSMPAISIPANTSLDTIIKFVDHYVVNPFGLNMVTPPPVLTGTPGLYNIGAQLSDSICGKLELRITVECKGTTGQSALQNLMPNILIYPNPANDFINIECDKNNNGINVVKIYDYQGKLFKEYLLDENQRSAMKLSINELSIGMYFIHVENKSGSVIKKIAVSR